MAKAGYCSACGTNVWLDASGGCANGHGRECVSRVYEVATQSSPQQGRNLALLIMLPIALVILLVVAIMFAIAVPVFSSAKANAQRRACYANERVVEGAEAAYLAGHEGAPPAADWAELSAQISPAIIRTVPVCAEGGTYTWVPAPGSPLGGYATCSVHGSYTGR